MKWRTGRLDSLLAYDYYSKEEPVLCDTASERVVNTYLSYTEDERIKRSGYAKIRQAQNMILEQRLQKKHAIIEKRIDRKMQEIKPLPKDFDDWIDEVAMAHSRYIYYRYSRKKYMDGYCTHCHKEVKVHKVRHRAEGYCPNCGVKVIFLAEGKAKYIFNLCVTILISRFTLYSLIFSVAHPFVNSWYSFINSATQALSLLSLPQNPYACMTALSLA